MFWETKICQPPSQVLHRPYQEVQQELFPVPMGQALGDRDIYSSNVVIQVGTFRWGTSRNSHVRTAGIDPVSQEPGEGWVALTSSLSPPVPPSTPICGDSDTPGPPHALRRFSLLCVPSSPSQGKDYFTSSQALRPGQHGRDIILYPINKKIKSFQFPAWSKRKKK